ncbi:hypothetical protein [Aliikangiella sp. G2MR2-5]|uniref:hypothetical protein n=1 Tax=Aliikangiella sp. G2MR2-5 TaxID=2788943 RepID=UPI0018AA61C8|nr:hypothetical protein [Aliikangiella sp. G2MR2-5]
MVKRILFTMLCLSLSFPLCSQSLYVFVPTETRANVMQEKINSFCPGVEVTAFGRAKDFHKQIEQAPPNAILSLLPVLERTSDYITALKGLKNGLETENYVLVSVDSPLKMSEIGQKKIGVVDLLGRKPMTSFVEQLFKTPVKLKRVTKVEDLLPLITFGSVDGIFVSSSLFNQLKAKSNLNLVATNLDIKIGLASAAHNDAQVKDKLKSCILAFDQGLNSILGVDQWRTL